MNNLFSLSSLPMCRCWPLPFFRLRPFNATAERMPQTVARFCLLTLLLVNARVELAALQTAAMTDSDLSAKRPSFGQLRKLSFKGGNGRYELNGTELSRVSKESVILCTVDQSIKVRVTFLSTVLVSGGEPIYKNDSGLLKDWAENVPRVEEILKRQDKIGSLKLITYDLVKSKDHKDPKLQEQLTLLWTTDPMEIRNIGHTGFGSLISLSQPVADIQYRSPNGVPDRLFSKMFLQILYVLDGARPIMLGALGIFSKASGEYEFYSVPRFLLNQIVIDAP